MIYLITYDLHAKKSDVEGLTGELKRSPAWANYIERTWLIGTDETAEQLHDRIVRHLSQEDFWLVVRITDEYYGWLPQEAWDWIENTKNAIGL